MGSESLACEQAFKGENEKGFLKEKKRRDEMRGTK